MKTLIILIGIVMLGVLTPAAIATQRTARGVVTTAPDQVQLWFNEELEPAFARLSVWSADSTEVDLGNAMVAPDDPKLLSVGLHPLTPGSYTVKYRVLSVDGHVVEREFPFTFRAP